jgi:heparin binding hemagglutinin HbhA
MTLPHSIEKAREDLRKTLSDPTPLYAVVGIADAAAASIRAQVDDALTGAIETYDGLAGRGRTLVRRVRRQEATGELRHQAKATATKAKAATTTSRKSAKSAATSTRKTAAAARKAGRATSAKLGT